MTNLSRDLLFVVAPPFCEASPAFAEDWENTLSEWPPDESPAALNFMMEVGYWVLDHSEDTEEVSEIFRAAEELLALGNPDVQDVIVTGFLEDLVDETLKQPELLLLLVPGLPPLTRALWDQEATRQGA